ncbi:hypothetical protein NQ318_019497 [Aromia moschata]|uniref:Ribosomal protein n=1 Tax=Aromia moschata TaxID=1265417 RepID=A0AAV8XY80_9CUCU|nr:hypothetical protein NQ318_019497 [Aromia moschata]
MFSVLRNLLINATKRINLPFNSTAMYHMLSKQTHLALPQQTQQKFLIPVTQNIIPSCGFKVVGKVKKRCKDCYFVRREERLYIICKTHPRHKQMSMVKDPKNTWILTHATQSKILLETSFTPASSSTQTSFSQKRLSQVNTDKGNYKKLRLYNEEQQSITYKDKEIKHSPKKIEENIETSVSVPSKIVKRKFPGPAGLLPERREHNKSILDFISDDKAHKVNRTQDEMFLCSQRTVSVFEDGPWKEMTKDFYVPNGEAPYEKFTIKWIKKQASLKKLLVNHKAPFLAGIIESLEIFDGKIPTVNVTLKDATGEIQGTVLHSLYEDYCNFFTIGSVLVLKQFGVLSGGYKKPLSDDNS